MYSERVALLFAERMLISLEEEMSLHCIGTIPELFDGNPPFTGRGAVSFCDECCGYPPCCGFVEEV